MARIFKLKLQLIVIEYRAILTGKHPALARVYGANTAGGYPAANKIALQMNLDQRIVPLLRAKAEQKRQTGLAADFNAGGGIIRPGQNPAGFFNGSNFNFNGQV